MRVSLFATCLADDFFADMVLVSSVAAEAGGLTAEVIAGAVWDNDIQSAPSELTAGYILNHTRALATTVASGDTTTSFTLTAGLAENDVYNGMVIMVEDDTDDHYESRRIVDYTSGRVVTVDRAFAFTPATGDDVYIQAAGYADVNVTHLAASAVQQASGYIKISDGTGTGQVALASGKVDVSHLAGSAIMQDGGYIKVSDGTGTGQIALASGKVDVSHLAGSAIQQASGYVKVSAGTGTGQISLSSGTVTVGTNNDKGPGAQFT